uniref:Serpentine receptor class gamma n=1 Tax=Panagrellus redivivus TaxID=6233 RepID=A0A7E4W4L9_PANRE
MIRPRPSNEFGSSFFTIAKVLAVVDLCGHIGSTVMFKMPLTPFFASFFKDIQPSYFWSVPYFMTNYLEFVHTMLVMLTALNRWTALILPIKYEKIWKKLIWPAIGGSFLVPFCITFQRLAVPTVTLPFSMNSSDSYVFSSEKVDWIPDGINALLFALFYIVAGVITILLNATSCVSLSLAKQNNQPNLHPKSLWQSIQRTEIGLIIVSFSDMIAMCCMIVIQLTLFWLGIRGLYYDPLYDAMYLQIPWVFDLQRFIRPFMLLFMSKSMRDAFLSTIYYHPKPTTSITTPAIFIVSSEASFRKASKISIGLSPIYHS